MGVVSKLDFWTVVATCKLNEEEIVKVKDGIENELIVVKDEKEVRKVRRNSFEKLNLFVAIKVFAQKTEEVQIGCDQIKLPIL